MYNKTVLFIILYILNVLLIFSNIPCNQQILGKICLKDSATRDYIDVCSKNISFFPCLTRNQQIILMFIAKTSKFLHV
jgi:hypothetical protein